MTRSEIAEALGVSRARITQMLREPQNYTVDTIEEFLRACHFGIDIHSKLRDELDHVILTKE